MKVLIIRYNAGNVRSVVFALNRLGVDPVVSDDPSEIEKADKVIFPGVGEASSTMRTLHETGLVECIKNLRQPVLGICLGLQLMCASSEEGDTEGLGIFDVAVKKFPIRDVEGKTIKVPHIGWNSLENRKGPLFNSVFDDAFVYFVHSYYAVCGIHDSATTNYGIQYASAMQKDNFFATQFHPEKSGRVGEIILANFLRL